MFGAIRVHATSGRCQSGQRPSSQNRSIRLLAIAIAIAVMVMVVVPVPVTVVPIMIVFVVLILAAWRADIVVEGEDFVHRVVLEAVTALGSRIAFAVFYCLGTSKNRHGSAAFGPASQRMAQAFNIIVSLVEAVPGERNIATGDERSGGNRTT